MVRAPGRLRAQRLRNRRRVPGSVELLEDRLLPSSMTFTVTNTSDLDGQGKPVAGSLRAAILAANANAGGDTITFKIGSGAKTIALAAALPTITSPVSILANTQPGYDPGTGKTTSTPVIKLDGANAGAGANGLTIQASSCIVIGLVIDNFKGDGIRLSRSDNCIILANFIGVDFNGSTARPNGGDGIRLLGSQNNSIGANGSNTRNIISGNLGDGVAIMNIITPIQQARGSIGNIIAGNYIGTDKTGNALVIGPTGTGNRGNGVLIEAGNNTIGGAGAGNGNVIAGNGQAGITVLAAPLIVPSGNQILGNLIGTNLPGTSGLGNHTFGVLLEQAPHNTIGGTAAGSRNVISANGFPNVYIDGASASGNVVAGNLIGTNAAGTAKLAGGGGGVIIVGAPGNTVGGLAAGARNLISGNNGAGVDIAEPGADNNVVEGNFIGTDLTGTLAISNADGVFVGYGASSTTIGGTVIAARNLISGNAHAGVDLFESPAIDAQGNHKPGNTVAGNLIGTNATGLAALANVGDGVVIENASYNTIGSFSPLGLNVISGNTQNGIHVKGAASFGLVAVGNTIIGNFVGTTITGNTALANGLHGVFLDTYAASNTVGSSSPLGRNIISGNSAQGVMIDGAGNGNNIVVGNYIGTGKSGLSAVPNHNDGLLIKSTQNFIGGSHPGEGNLISGNAFEGILLSDVNAADNVIQGNLIGTDKTSAAALPNGGWGVQVSFAPANLIGGLNAAAGNVISGNALDGILLNASGAFNNTVQGNFLGTDATGTSPVPNQGSGMLISGSAHDNLIGGANLPGAGNTIAFNVGNGVTIDSGSHNAVVSNSIFLNQRLGIDLGPTGVTSNDPNDLDTGANQLQNFPVLASAVSNDTSTVVSGQINSNVSSTYLIQLFASEARDPSGYGAGQRLIDSFTVSTSASSHNAAFSRIAPVPVPAGQWITATATDETLDAGGFSQNNTSEFSAALAVGAAFVAMDFNGTRQADLAQYTPETGVWTIAQGNGNPVTQTLGEPGDLPVPADYDGDGVTDLAVYRPGTGTWLIDGSQGGMRTVVFGAPNVDRPVPADYDGDGKADVAVYRPTTGQWLILRSSGGARVATFGAPNLDQPIPADYDGDGKADFALYRSSTGQWILWQSSAGVKVVAFGAPNLDQPVPADYDGDIRTDLALYRPSTATWMIGQSTAGPRTLTFGQPNVDMPVPADYDGDGKADIALFRPPLSLWAVRQSGGGTLIRTLGSSTDIPVVALLSQRAGSIKATSFFASRQQVATAASEPAFVPLVAPDAANRASCTLSLYDDDRVQGALLRLAVRVTTDSAGQ